MFYKWPQLLFENGSWAFERKKPHPESADQQKIHDLEARLLQKDNVIAEITQEFIAAKKRMGAIKRSLGRTRPSRHGGGPYLPLFLKNRNAY